MLKNEATIYNRSGVDLSFYTEGLLLSHYLLAISLVIAHCVTFFRSAFIASLLASFNEWLSCFLMFCSATP